MAFTNFVHVVTEFKKPHTLTRQVKTVKSNSLQLFKYETSTTTKSGVETPELSSGHAAHCECECTQEMHAASVQSDVTVTHYN